LLPGLGGATRGLVGVLTALAALAGISRYVCAPIGMDLRKKGQSVVRRVSESRASAREMPLADLRTTAATSSRGRARRLKEDEGEEGGPPPPTAGAQAVKSLQRTSVR
jgi:hypothetical protein